MDKFGPIIFLCTIIIGFVIFYERKKSTKIQAEGSRKFWEREEKSNFTRKKDISFLNYITIPLDKLPMETIDDDEITEYQQCVTHLSQCRILNLTGYSNTDLKLEYGVANLTVLMEYDNNYSTLVNVLAKWGYRLFQLNMDVEAVTVLEYGISIGTDVSRNFYLLADYYCKKQSVSDIDRLIAKADQITTLMKPSIMKKLNEIRSNCD